MGVWFESSHPAGDFSDGRLWVGIGIEDDAMGQTRYDEVSFEVPPDFHVHNDLVAAALMTLVGRTSPTVRFNFPISERCAAILSAHYNLTEVGPVDPSLEPRRRGRLLGLLFSGGVDSTSAYLLLRQIGVEFRVITNDYGGGFQRERIGYEQFPRDITCTTDIRPKRFDRMGRFNFSTPLLFADYLDLYGVASGHNVQHGPPTSGECLDRGQQPSFLRQDRVLNAGGLDEVHLVRPLSVTGNLTVILMAGPEYLENALIAAGRPGTEKYYIRAMMARWLCQQLGRPLPTYLESIEPTKRARRFGDGAADMSAVYLAKIHGLEVAEHICRGISRYDLSLLDDLTLDFYRKYNTNFAKLLPSEIHDRVLNAFHGWGVYPYDERDWREVGMMRAFLEQAGQAHAARGAQRRQEREGAELPLRH